MYPQYMAKYVNSQKSSTENCHFNIRGKSLFIAWACFRNVLAFTGQMYEVSVTLFVLGVVGNTKARLPMTRLICRCTNAIRQPV